MNKALLLEKAKELNIPRRNCMKTKEEPEKAIQDIIIKYEEIMFGADIPVCMTCLDELRKQQVIDQKAYDQKLMNDMLRKLAWESLQKNIVLDGDKMIHRRTSEVLDPGVDFMYWRDKFLKVDFIVFVDHKIICRKAKELHVLNGTDILDT